MAVTVQHADGVRIQAKADSHTVAIDAALEDGGGDTSMSAPQLFVEAIGACILGFVLSSRRLRRTPVDRLSIEMTQVGRLEMAIRLEPDPPVEVVRRLLGVARHATLVNTQPRPPEASMHFAGTGG